MSSGKANILAIVVRLLDLKLSLPLAAGFDVTDDQVGGVRMAQDGIERQGAGNASHHPADRRIAEILIRHERIDLQEVGGGGFPAAGPNTAGSHNAR